MNSSPAVAEALLEQLVDDLIEVQVNRYFVGATKSKNETAEKYLAASSPVREENGWELLFEGAETH